jgi:hypothetical protein
LCFGLYLLRTDDQIPIPDNMAAIAIPTPHPVICSGPLGSSESEYPSDAPVVVEVDGAGFDGAGFDGVVVEDVLFGVVEVVVTAAPTIICPVIQGCTWQKYGYVPAFVKARVVYVLPALINPLSHTVPTELSDMFPSKYVAV